MALILSASANRVLVLVDDKLPGADLAPIAGGNVGCATADRISVDRLQSMTSVRKRAFVRSCVRACTTRSRRL